MKHKTLQLSEDDLHKPFLTVEACGHEVSVSITQDYTQFGTNTAENMWKSSNEILCVDATVYKAVNSTNSCVLVALGLSDGSIVLYSISTTRCNRFSNFSIAKLIAPVRDISFCSQCCLSAVSAAAECVLVYYDLNVALTALQRTVRVNVELPGLSSTPHSASFEKSVQVTCMYDVGRNTVTTGNGSSSSASAVSAFLNAHCSSTAVAAAAAATTNPASSANNNSRSDTVLLLGCADGSVRWVLTPQTGNVLPLAHMPRLPREVCNNEGCALTEDGGKEGDENEEEPLSVHSALLESFGAPIKALLLGDAPYSDDYSRTAALWVVQEGGACTVLGLRPRLPAGQPCGLVKCLHQITLPKDVCLETLQLLRGVLLYVSQHTGGLCACYCTEGEEGTYSRELPSGGALSTMVSVALTPASAPGIISFSLVSSCCDDVSDGRNNGSGAHCQVQEHHRVLFETTDGPRECVFTLPGSEDSTDTDKKGLMRSAVVQVLQRVCGGGPHSRHPQSMLSVAAVLSGDEEVGHSVEADVARSHSQSEYDQDAAVEALGMELTAAHLSYDAAQQRLQVLDCELLQLMALLAVLGDARDGLIMHAGTATETWDITGRADLLDWSPSLRNKSGSLSLKFRFRCEPIAGTGDLGPGNGVLLDIALTAHTLEAMRALQGCSLLMALHPTAAASCLHPSMDTCSAILELRPVVATAQNSEMSNREQQQQQHQYQFRHTFAVSSLSQMCAYRLTLSVAVDGPEAPTCATTQAALFTDAGALLGLVDLLIPLIYWLPVLQRSPDFAATEQLKKLMKDGNSDRGSGEVSSSSSGDPLVHELILNINGSAAAAAAIEKWISAVGVGGAADGAGAGAGSNGGNPLRAAFLPQQPEQPPVPRSLVTLIRQAANPSGEASRGKDKGKHKDKDKDTGGTPIVVTLRSSHREVLAAVSADVSAVLLPSNSEVDRVEELSVDVGMSATLDGSKYDHLPHNLQQVAAKVSCIAHQHETARDPAAHAVVEDVMMQQQELAAAEEQVWRLYQQLRRS